MGACLVVFQFDGILLDVHNADTGIPVSQIDACCQVVARCLSCKSTRMVVYDPLEQIARHAIVRAYDGTCFLVNIYAHLGINN